MCQTAVQAVFPLQTIPRYFILVAKFFGGLFFVKTTASPSNALAFVPPK